MKKILTMIAVAAVAGSAIADLSSFSFKGGKLFDKDGAALGQGTYTDGALTYLVDLSAFVSDNKINIMDIGAAYGVLDIAVAPAIPFGGVYSTGNLVEQPSTSLDQIAYLVIDSNGGGINVGDFIGIATAGTIVDLKPDDNPAAAPQVFTPGDVTSNIEVIGIPEPATLGLMGIAGLGMFLARKKAHK